MSAGPDPRHARQVLAITCGATFMVFLDATIVNVAFPDVRDSFEGSSLATLSWVVNAYAVIFAALLVPWGRFADVVGRRRIFLLGTALFTGASVACTVAPSVEVLIAARFLQGAGAAAMLPTAIALLLPEFPPERRAVAIGAWGAAGSVAAAAGPALGGVLVDLADWRLVFLVNLPIGAALLAGADVLREHELPAERRLPDLMGTALVAAGVGLVVLGITKGEDWGWGDPQTLGALAAGLALSSLALFRARTHPAPAIETGLWRVRAFAIVNLASLVYGVALFAFLLNGVLFLVAVWGYSVLEAGLAVTPGAVLAALVAPPAGKLVAKRGVRAAMVPGGVLMTLDCVWILLALETEPNFVGLWLPTGTIAGLALTLVAVGLATGAATSLPPRALGAGFGMNQTARQLGGALGVAALVALISAQPGIDGYKAGWAMCGIAAAVGTAIAAALRPEPERRRVPAGAGAEATEGARL